MASKEDNDVPKVYNNLDEVAAPPPAKARKHRLRLGYSSDQLMSKENSRSVGVHQEGNRTDANQKRQMPNGQNRREMYDEPDSFGNLDEVASPSPLDPEEERRKEHLEDRSDALPARDNNADKDRPASSRKRVSRLATELYTISYLIFFSLLGTLARLGLQALTFYPGAPVQTGLLWANVGGSLFMGFLSQDRKLFREGRWDSFRENQKETSDEEGGKRYRRSPSADKQHAAVKKTIPLFIGLSTGFCGSFTSFSSFMRDAFYALSNALPVPVSHPSTAPISTTVNVHRNPGYSFMAVLAVLVITGGLSLGALQVGAHLAFGLEPLTPSIPSLFVRKIVDRSLVVLAWGCWLGAIVMAIVPPDRPEGPVSHANWAQETWRSQTLFALVFAPLGCLLRFYVSLHLNSKIKSFPLGTFAVNIFGTAMEAMFIVLQRTPIGGMIGCQILQGMIDGYCGCLTTVSTWVSELKGLQIRHAYFYAVMSMGVALCLMVLIAGSFQWTHGFAELLCKS